ncbi:hypothetical protein XENOCAPTIV_017613, partial [Xenoophorus captivus]
EKIMGSFSLQPDMAEESADLQLEESFAKQLLEKYCSKSNVFTVLACCFSVCVLPQEDMSAALDRLVELEYETVWKDKREPRKEDNILISPFPMDIWTVRH